MGLFSKKIPEEEVEILAKLLQQQADLGLQDMSVLVNKVKSKDDVKNAELLARIYFEFIWFDLYILTLLAADVGGQAGIQKLIVRIRPYVRDNAYQFLKADTSKDEFSKMLFDGAEEVNNYYVDNIDPDATSFDRNSPAYLLSMRIITCVNERSKEKRLQHFALIIPKVESRIEQIMNQEVEKQVKKALK